MPGKKRRVPPPHTLDWRAGRLCIASLFCPSSKKFLLTSTFSPSPFSSPKLWLSRLFYCGVRPVLSARQWQPVRWMAEGRFEGQCPSPILTELTRQCALHFVMWGSHRDLLSKETYIPLPQGQPLLPGWVTSGLEEPFCGRRTEVCQREGKGHLPTHTRYPIWFLPLPAPRPVFLCSRE